MAQIYLYNSLSRKKETFTPLKSPHIGMYTCGPTVYDFAHIGNFRTYTTSDILVRLLGYNSFDVVHVMNLTDVGHLTGDNLGDADLGEDRMEKSARKEGKTAWDIAKYYSQVFISDMEQLNIQKPSSMPKATDHLTEQISLIKKLEEKNLTYLTSDGVYFDTVKFEKITGKKYGELSTLDVLREGARVEANPEKKNPRDFALWKFSPQDVKRQMEWDSPWGKGFPGWHIECSAMSTKYLGNTLDVHVGGEDLRSTHHPNEIAQSEGATGETFVKYWVHVTFLQVDGARMSKSKGNVYTVSDVIKKGFDPLALRYLYLTSHYRDTLNFTWESLSAAQTSLLRLRKLMAQMRRDTVRTTLSNEKLEKVNSYREDFLKSINDDLNTPKALAVIWEVIKSNIPSPDKYDLVLSADEVLGLNLSKSEVYEIPTEIKDLSAQRTKLRKEGKYDEADKIRVEIEKKGFVVRDTSAGVEIEKLST
jgi:cysteinyl-tRNA synthetase